MRAAWRLPSRGGAGHRCVLCCASLLLLAAGTGPAPLTLAGEASGTGPAPHLLLLRQHFGTTFEERHPSLRARFDATTGLLHSTGLRSGAMPVGSDLPAVAGKNKKSWADHYDRLKEFKLTHGHPHVLRPHPLHPWVRTQRKHFKTGTLSKEHEQSLRAIGVSFVPSRVHNLKKLRQRAEMLRKLRSSRCCKYVYTNRERTRTHKHRMQTHPLKHTPCTYVGLNFHLGVVIVVH
jgi:hypothetical protein